jgi:hypothetical protein
VVWSLVIFVQAFMVQNLLVSDIHTNMLITSLCFLIIHENQAKVSACIIINDIDCDFNSSLIASSIMVYLAPVYTGVDMNWYDKYRKNHL